MNLIKKLKELKQKKMVRNKQLNRPIETDEFNNIIEKPVEQPIKQKPTEQDYNDVFNMYLHSKQEEKDREDFKQSVIDKVVSKSKSNVNNDIAISNKIKQIVEEDKEETIDNNNNQETDYDFVNHPSSYTNHIIETKQGIVVYETIEYLESLAKRLSQWLNPDEVFNVVSGAKYLDGIRGSKPDGNKTPRQKIAEDCEKIAWYLNRASWLIKENDKSGNK